jgi:hypothetical protein
MVVDPDDMEDVLKVDSNPETGEGGDDGYDALRVGMASRPPRAIGSFFKGDVRAFSSRRSRSWSRRSTAMYRASCPHKALRWTI